MNDSGARDDEKVRSRHRVKERLAGGGGGHVPCFGPWGGMVAVWSSQQGDDQLFSIFPVGCGRVALCRFRSSLTEALPPEIRETLPGEAICSAVNSN